MLLAHFLWQETDEGTVDDLETWATPHGSQPRAPRG
jgi:hypothetical protein